MLDDSFHVYDTTLRDGAQQEGLNLTVADKLVIARQLDELGVGFIEGGWPGAIPKDTEFFRRAVTELDLKHAQLAAFGATRRNTQENFLAAAAKIGLDIRDIPPCVTFFAPVSLDDAGRFLWNPDRKRPGDFVDLRAEMNLVVVASNCAHPLDPARPAASGPVTLIKHRVPPRGDDDLCRTASPEAARAFAFTDRLYA